MKLPLVGAILLALSLLSAPVAAQECANDFDVTFNQFVSHPEVLAGNVLLAQVPAEKLPALVESLTKAGIDVPADVTRAFLILGPEGTIVGLESGGCLLPPIRINTPLPVKGSGRLPDGRTMA